MAAIPKCVSCGFNGAGAKRNYWLYFCSQHGARATCFRCAPAPKESREVVSSGFLGDTKDDFIHLLCGHMVRRSLIKDYIPFR